MEIVEVLLLVILAIEGALIYMKKDEEKERGVHTSRREVYGTFQNPLGDSYRKNSKSQYVPIRPYSKMLDGDEKDEV